MRKVFLIVFIGLVSLTTRGQKLNFDAVEYYFKITDSLRQNHPLSQQTWKKFLGHPGLSLYLKNQNFDSLYLEAYRKNLEYVYMPKHDSILNLRLKNNQKYFLAYLINNYKVKEQALKSYYQKIRENPSIYLDSVYTNCYTMLPEKMRKKAVQTTFYFIPFQNDAVAEDNDVVFTLYCAYHFDKLKFGALGGHELHHLLRKNKTIKSQKDKYLYEALTLLLHEGSADLIDKSYTTHPDCPVDLKYFEFFMDNCSNYLAQLDSAIQQHAANRAMITSKNIPALVTMSGHIPGCYMAYLIEKHGFKNELIRNVNDPITFILLYNKAAKSDKEKPYCFSEITIRYLTKIR